MADLQPITHLIVLYLVGEQVPRAGRACAIRVRQGLPIWPCPPPSLTFSVWQGSGGNLICVISACVWVSRVPVSDRTMPNFAEPCPNPRDQTCIQDLQFMSMPLPPATPQEARPGATSTPPDGSGTQFPAQTDAAGAFFQEGGSHPGYSSFRASSCSRLADTPHARSESCPPPSSAGPAGAAPPPNLTGSQPQLRQDTGCLLDEPNHTSPPPSSWVSAYPPGLGARTAATPIRPPPAFPCYEFNSGPTNTPPVLAPRGHSRAETTRKR